MPRHETCYEYKRTVRVRGTIYPHGPLRAKLHYTDTSYGHVVQHHQRTPTDERTTILQQICHIAMPEPNISTCQDVGMWQIFVRRCWICCTTSRRILVSSSVGGVRCQLVVFVTGVRSRCPCSGVRHLTKPEAEKQRKRPLHKRHRGNTPWDRPREELYVISAILKFMRSDSDRASPAESNPERTEFKLFSRVQVSE